MKLIVGLGNPGKEYSKTRHNIGFMCLDEIAEYFNVDFDSKKFNGSYTQFNHKGEKIILLKPLKYMNLSGEVVRAFVDFYKINISDLLIISDDIDMQCGKIRLRMKGSSGGHNGLKNIELHLGTSDYKRLKIGLGNNKNLDTKDFVLGKLNVEEEKILLESIEKSEIIIEDFLKIDFNELMSKYN